jgi:dTDP-4-amino-4,6-dideoxygalactose transaminase
VLGLFFEFEVGRFGAVSMSKKNIYVTQPQMPPLEEFLPYLEKIWESKWLTNAGPFHQQLEFALSEYLGVEHLSLFSNGTIALITALQALRATGEVITTPFSFVATAHSLLWNGIKPIFVDIDPVSLNLDPKKIESAITPHTTAIMPVHVYGNACAVDEIQQIADRYGLKVIYDAAHAFAVEHDGGSLLRYGDLSVLSFHATKVFNTFEGGAIVSPDAATKQRIDFLKNFGFADELTVVAPGINGKMNEVQAAFGLLQLKHVDAAIVRRKHIDMRYRDLLASIRGIRCLPLTATERHNYSYFPILVESDYRHSRDGLYDLLKRNNVFSRRYFYPLISQFPMYRGFTSAAPSNLPVATEVAQKILCLPIYPDLLDDEIETICTLIDGAR